MSPTTYLITGAGRGLGLEYTRQILAGNPEARVIAAVRKLPADGVSDELAGLENDFAGRIGRLQMDIVSVYIGAAGADTRRRLRVVLRWSV